MSKPPPGTTTADPHVRLDCARALHAIQRARFAMAPTATGFFACILTGLELDRAVREVAS